MLRLQAIEGYLRVQKGYNVTESDRQLLDRYVNDDDHDAFEQLVRRHSSMVFGVCLNVLSKRQDAEDAFQLTFMTLSIKASRLSSYDSIGGWLHETSLRTCLSLRRKLGRKREVGMKTSPKVNEGDHWEKITAEDESELIHKEIVGLPANYRDVIVLCHLEGKSRAQAADILNTTTASIKGTLSRARKMLRHRLLRRGIATTAALATASGTNCAFAASNTIVVESLIKTTLGNCLSGGTGMGVAGLQSGLLKGKIASTLSSIPASAAAIAAGVMLVGIGSISLWAASVSSIDELPVAFAGSESRSQKITPVSLEISAQQDPQEEVQDPENEVNNNFIMEVPLQEAMATEAVEKARLRFQRVIDDIAQSVDLTEDQRKRLEIAAKGAVKQLEESRDSDENANVADGLRDRLELELALAQRASQRQGVDVDNEFWNKVVEKVLTEDQLTDYKNHLEQRKVLAKEARAAVFVAEADNELLLSAEARNQLTEFVMSRIVDNTNLRRPGLPQNLALEDLQALQDLLGEDKMKDWSRPLELRLIRLIYE